MRKKIALTLICLCFLFLFGGCYPNDYFYPPDPEEDYSYEVYWYFQGDGPEAGEEVPDEYSFPYYDKIYVYSVAAREITQVLSSKDGWVDAYAINDDYIFFITGANAGPKTPAAKLWKYDRKTDACELFTEISKNYYRLALYQGYVLYGGWDIIACPIDGYPEEDSISLLAQFPEGVSAYKMRDIVYQGWRIRRESDGSSDRVLFIKDEENAKVILTSSAAGEWLDANGELIFFTGSRYGGYRREYQRENEQEKRSFDCLQDCIYDYDGAAIRQDRLGVEDGKIICLLTVVGVRDSYDVEQNRVRKDVLFEIDLEADSSRVIYDTGDNKTRVIGYRGGTLYLLEDDIIYRESLEGGDRERVFDLRDGSVDLYRSDDRHASIKFIVWGDNLIVRPYDGTKGMFTIPLFNQAEDNP